jgi:hypothetical protein
VKKISNFSYILFIFSLILVFFILPFLLFDDVKRGRKSIYFCAFVLCIKNFQDIHLQKKGGDIQDRGRFIEQQYQKDMVCHHQKGGDCEEDFLLELG